VPISDIAGRVVVARQLSLGMSPRDILVGHYGMLWKASKVAGSSTASEYRMAMKVLAAVKPSFFMDLAKSAEVSLVSIVEMFKDSRVVSFFGKIGWSLKNLWDILRHGFHVAKTLLNIVALYVAKMKVMRWSKEELGKLDDFLSTHPQIRRIAGVGVGALLVFLWFAGPDIGDVDWDFDLSDVMAALGGTYSLSDIFAGRDGSKLLMTLALGGLTGLTFPWPVASSIGFAIAVIRTLAKKLRMRIQPARHPVEQEAQELGIA
jgi:hypothetical protein